LQSEKKRQKTKIEKPEKLYKTKKKTGFLGKKEEVLEERISVFGQKKTYLPR